MANNNLVAFPMVEEINYRQKIDSKQLNTMFRSIEESVLRSILRGNEINDYLNSLNLGVVSSYNALQSHERSFAKYPISSGAFASSFDDIVYNDIIPKQEVMTGITTLNWSKDKFLSKIPRVNEEVSPNVEIYLDDELRSSEDHIYNCLNRDHASFFLEQTSEPSGTLELKLPPSVNKRFNYVEIVPFPVFGVEVTRVTYLDLQSVERDIYNKNNNQYPYYNNTGPMIFHTQPKEFNNVIKIYYKTISGVDVVGFSSIDVGLIDYNNNETVFYLPFKNLHNVTNILPTNIELDFHVDGVISDNYDKYFKGGISIVNSTDGTGTSIPLTITRDVTNYNTTISVTNGLWLRVSMNEVDMTTPMFRGCKFIF